MLKPKLDTTAPTRHGMIHALRRAMPLGLKRGLMSAYTRVFQPHVWRAHKVHQFSDGYEREVHILEAMNYLRVASLPQVYFEFGCWSARTFSAAIRASRVLNLSDPQFYAFDSFEGLPEVSGEESMHFKGGMYATPLGEFMRLVHRFSGVHPNPENVIKGFYKETLTSQLQKRMPKVGLVYIDVDLYSSTAEILAFIRPLLVVGTVLMFDDWFAYAPGANMGEARALKEFLSANPDFRVEDWKAYSNFGKSFFVTSVAGT